MTYLWLYLSQLHHDKVGSKLNIELWYDISLSNRNITFIIYLSGYLWRRRNPAWWVCCGCDVWFVWGGGGEGGDNLSVAGCGEHEQVCSKIGHQSLTLYSVFSSFFKPVVLSCLWLRRMNKFKTECLSVITEHKI